MTTSLNTPKAQGPRILCLSYDDYANLAHDHARAMQSIGLNAVSMKLRPHSFSYTMQSEVVSIPVMGYTITQSDIVILYHSTPHMVELVKNFVSKSTKSIDFIGFHTGSIYRADPIGTRRQFDAAGCRLHLTDQCEFLIPESGKDLIYVAAAVDCRSIRAQGTFPQIGSTYVIAHYPSKADVKGSETIRRMMAEHGKRFSFLYSEERVPHSRQIQRMSKCDIYLELFQNTLNGQPYGCYGVTAFEAAALGRVVMTQNIYAEAYRSAYGVETPFLLCNTEEQFGEKLRLLADLTPRSLLFLQQKTYDWVQQYHSLEATGRRLEGILLK